MGIKPTLFLNSCDICKTKYIPKLTFNNMWPFVGNFKGKVALFLPLG